MKLKLFVALIILLCSCIIPIIANDDPPPEDDGYWAAWSIVNDYPGGPLRMDCVGWPHDCYVAFPPEI